MMSEQISRLPCPDFNLSGNGGWFRRLSFSKLKCCLKGLFLTIVPLAGCTSTALRHSTVSVSTSVGVILEQQVLENLSRIYDAPYSMPSQVVLSSGAIQVQNQLTSTLKLPYTVTAKNSKEADLGSNMQWQETWTITPVTDSEDMYRLQFLYQGAVKNLLPENKKPVDHVQYLAFDAGPIHFGATIPITDCVPTTTTAISDKKTPSSRFEDCTAIAKLLGDSKNWLAFDSPPNPGSDQDVQHPADGFIERSVYGRTGRRIWVRPKEFSEFMLYVLFATPKSNSNVKPLNIAVSP
jgi:hypothetical protein